MINEQATFEKYGYYSTDLKPVAGKRVVAVCDVCGAVRYPRKADYRDLCWKCVKKHTEEHNQKISDGAPKGEDHHNWK